MRVERVAIFTAMVQEMRPVIKALRLRREDLDEITAYRGDFAGIDVLAVVTEMGTASARRVSAKVLDLHPVDHVVVVGIAGAVDPDLDIGSLVIPETVIDAETGAEYRPTASGAGLSRGTLLTTDGLLDAPSDLGALVRRGIVAVDMETAAVGAVCRDRGIAWSVFRAISDRAGDPATDTSVIGLVNPNGSARLPSVVRFLVSRPAAIPHLVRLARGMRVATRTAAEAAVSWLANH